MSPPFQAAAEPPSGTIGNAWTVQTTLAAQRIDAMAYCGNGVVVIGTRNDSTGPGKIFRSTDHGLNWTDIGQISIYGLLNICYLGSNIVLASGYEGHVFRSTDGGATWPTFTTPATGTHLYSMCKTTAGTVLLTSTNGKIYRSTDLGVSWDAGTVVNTTTDGVYRLQKVSGSRVLVDDFVGHVWYSDNDGVSWTDVGQIDVTPMYAIEYCGNSICLVAAESGKIYRSTNNGTTWGQVFAGSGSADDFVYLGDGRVVLSMYTGGMLLYLSTDYGVNWTNVGTVPTPVVSLEHAIYVEDGGQRYGIGGTHDGRIVFTR